MTEAFSQISLHYTHGDDTGSQNISYEINGDPILSDVLRKLQLFLQGIGYGVDELVARVEVQGKTIEHSSEET